MNKSFSDYKEPSKYLKAIDIIDKAPLDVEIADFHEERMGKDKDSKLCVTFVGQQKPFVLNATNLGTLEDLFGEPESAIRKTVTLVVLENQEYQGKLHDVIRIASKKPKPSLRKKFVPALEEEFAAKKQETDSIPY